MYQDHDGESRNLQAFWAIWAGLPEESVPEAAGEFATKCSPSRKK
jgi:hypothetical protein